MKMLKTLCAALGLSALSFSAFATGGTPTGSGTEADPFVVMDADDLVAIATSVNAGETLYSSKVIALGANVSLSGREWEPIGFRTDSPKVSRYWTGGTFDGRGFTISDMSTTNAYWTNGGIRQCGLVGAANGVTVKNLRVYNAKINGKTDCGVIIGRTNGGNNMISNCVVESSTIIGTNRMGALCGNTMSSSSFKIIDCQLLDTTVSGTGSMVGGLVGMGQNVAWSAVGCTINNLTITTSDEDYVPGLVCGRINTVNVTLTDLTVGGDCGTTPLIGYMVGSDAANAPVVVRIDGDSSLDVTSFYGSATGSWQMRQYSGKSTYKVPAELRVPGSTLSDPVDGWYTIDTSNIIYVGTEAELRALTNFNYAATTAQYQGKYILLTKDVALSSADWEPIGCKEKSVSPKRQYYFCGTIDGDGHTISGLTMKSTTATYRGFIGVAAGCTVKNLTLSGADMEISGGTLGGFIGLGASDKASCDTIENCKLVNSTISGASRVGGLAAAPEYGVKIFDCSVENSTINGSSSVGAVVGACYRTVICSNTCVYATSEKLAAAFGSASGTAIVGGDATQMQITNILQTASSALKVNGGLYSVPIPTENLASRYENQKVTIEEVDWYKVAISQNGNGTEDDPYLIRNEDNLLKYAADPAKYAGCYYKFLANVTLTKEWTGLFGTGAVPFSGNIDGNGYGITCGSYVTQDSFFGTVSNLVVQKLAVSLTKPLIGKVLEGGEVSMLESTVGGPASGAVIAENDGTISFESVVVTNAASALIANNVGAAMVTGEETDMDVAAICGDGSTGTMQIDSGRFHCTIPDDYVAEFYKVEPDATAGWNKVVPDKGSGTEDDPYVLIDEVDFQEFIADMQASGAKYKAAYITLANDITLTETVQPMTVDFTGVFDGNGKTIYNLTMSQATSNRGLFKQLNNAVVKNVTFKNANVAHSGRYCGLLAEVASNGSLIENCAIINSALNGYKEFGGFIYKVSSSVFSKCTIQDTTITYSDSTRAGVFANAVEGNSKFIDCVASGITSSDKLKLSPNSSATAVIDGQDTSMDIAGIANGVIKAGRFTFDPKDYVPSTRKVTTMEIGGTTWYEVKSVGTVFLIN